MQNSKPMNASLGQQVSRLANDTLSSLSQQTGDLGEKFGRIKEQVSTEVSHDAKVLQDATAKVIQKIPGYMTSIENSIRKHPYTLAAVALGVGTLSLTLLSRRTMKATPSVANLTKR